MLAHYEVRQCRATPYPELVADVKGEYEGVFLDKEWLTVLLNYLWKKARAACDESARAQGASYESRSGGFILVRLQLNKEAVVFGSVDGSRWEGENEIGQRMRQRQFAQVAQEQTGQGGQDQGIASRQKLASYGIDTLASRQQLVANPFTFRGRTVGLATSFGQMLSDKEAAFGSNGELVVTRVPSTLFRGNESVILAVKVIGTRSIKPPTGGEIFVPYVEFVGAWPVAPERAQLIRYLADALALSTETRDGQVGALIERALLEALPAVISTSGAASRSQ
jgi:hypothetical protein